ncbi:CcmD family protein [Dyadobacter tibetensis]|uniref:CcmD family protein n=1 Tax=Dyadobacter tibetensis TaxID=1211851 RepID=UPI0004B3C7D1|nr:CcmD family protein [Dyadobacter tibetensis]
MKSIKSMKDICKVLVILVLSTAGAYAQTEGSTVTMADQMRADGKIWVVVGVIAIVFLGIVVNLFRLEMKVRRMEKDLDIK